MSRDETTPVILSACRTPIGKYLGGLAPGVSYHPIPALARGVGSTNPGRKSGVGRKDG